MNKKYLLIKLAFLDEWSFEVFCFYEVLQK